MITKLLKKWKVSVFIEYSGEQLFEKRFLLKRNAQKEFERLQKIWKDDIREVTINMRGELYDENTSCCR